MQIDGIISSLLGGQTSLGRAERRARLDARAGYQAGGDPRFQRQPIFTPSVRTPQVQSPVANSPATSRQDAAEFSPAAVSGGEQSGPGALVESFVRQRAIFTYRSPQRPNQGSFDFTLDVEVAYRVVQFVPAGTNLDVQG